MQQVSAAFLAALTGSFTPVVQVDAWYDGELTLEGVPLIGGSLTVDSTRTIAGSGNLTFASPDASLIPSSWDSPLACYGSELHVRAGVQLPGGAAELVSLGWYRINGYSCVDGWREYTLSDGSPAWSAQGVNVTVDLSDRMADVDDARFLAPQQPTALTSAVQEITRLCQGIVPVEPYAGSDAPIPRSVTYTQSRVDAIQTLASLVGCQASLSPDGAMQLVPVTPGASVWDVTPSDTVDRAGRSPMARLVDWTRQGNRTGLYNAVVSSGTDPTGVPVQGIATQTLGPLRFGGPFGQVPYGHDSPLLTSDAAAAADAATTLKTVSDTQAVLLPVTVPANAALEVGDVITVHLPDRALVGPVQAITWALPTSVMTAQIAVPRAALWGAT